MKILKGIEIKGKGLWIAREKTLIIADLHLGYEEALVSDGVFIPKGGMFTEMKKEILELLELKPELVVINGDLKHEFSNISKQEWKDALELIDLISKESKIVLIKGNHDNILGPIAEKRNIEVKDYFILGDVCILHGDKIILEALDKNIKTLIIGHEHPAVSLSDNVKQEKYKCFLLGKYQKKNLIVMPSFFNLIEGTDMLREQILSPFLKNQDLGNFKIFIIGDKTYDFGKLGKLNEF
jgi:uncharacterized protein